jgi:thiosulfate dehydrogenase
MENKQQEREVVSALLKVTRYTVYVALLSIGCIVIAIVALTLGSQPVAVTNTDTSKAPAAARAESVNATAASRQMPADAWKAPDESTIPQGKDGEMIRYGKQLIVHTGLYFGPKGMIAEISNGMNCQNCHLDGGTRFWGNNYGSFIATYPKMSGRAGKIEPASERLVECFERSLNGKAPDTTKHEIQSMLAYMRWIGKDVKKGSKVVGAATEKLAFMEVPADPEKGKAVYMLKCQSCHGQNGEGLPSPDGKAYTNPPLWGKQSYNDGAGMYRLTNLAGFVKNNMPYGATYQNPQLTDEEAWNVAAFIDSQPRPHKDQHHDWKDLSKKPIDFPFGPYADHFSEEQHKYGPFAPIKAAQKKPTSKTS